MDLKWLRKVPLIRLLIPFIFGIIIQITLDFSISYLFESLIVLCLIISIVILSEKISENYQFRWLCGGLLYLLFFILGIYISDLHRVKLPNSKLDQVVTFTGRIIENPTEKEKSIKTIIEFISVEDSTEWKSLTGKSLVYFAKDSLSALLKYGDEIIFNNSISEIENSGNPHVFDYKNYLKNRNIVTQMYVASGKWKKLQNSKKGFFVYYAHRINEYLRSIYKRYNFAPKEYSVLAALTIGYTADLDDETKQAFSSTGAMHILSVSGLHVGVVYLVINFLFGFMNKKKYLKNIKIFVTILLLWAFAYISGLSPSVIRAAAMFSLMLVGELLGKDKNIYNIIAASAMLMLAVNPFVISDVGFQLSYIAVISIVFFQPKIYNAIYVKNKFVDKIWALLSVSIAAQLGTMPISLFYFHQFPNYFFITNIIVVPLSSLILYVSMALLAVSYINPIVNIVAFVLNILVKGLNLSIDFIDKLPFSSTKNLFISMPQVILMYFIILGITYFLINKRTNTLKLSLFLIVIYLLTDTYQEIKSINQKSIIVYNVKNACALNVIDGKHNVLICDTTVSNNTKTVDFIFKNNWLNRQVSDYELINIDSLQKDTTRTIFAEKLNFKDEFLILNNKKILIMREKKFAENVSPFKLDLDYIILSKNIYVSIDDICENFEFEMLIFDSSNKANRIERWKEECTELGVNYYSIPDSGAFVLDM